MGVYIKGMEVPESCYVCPFCDYVSARCDAVKRNPYTPESRYEKRADFCPLVPVPPHGGLIDVDAVEAVHGEWTLKNRLHPCGESAWHECSVCGNRAARDDRGIEMLSKCCPKCGAKMDGSREDGDGDG